MAKDQRELLKELVAAPFGKAQDILKQHGYWNEKAEPGDGVLRTYRVRVTGVEEIPFSQIITVEATSAAQAEELAEDDVDSSVNIHDTEIL